MNIALFLFGFWFVDYLTLQCMLWATVRYVTPWQFVGAIPAGFVRLGMGVTLLDFYPEQKVRDEYAAAIVAVRSSRPIRCALAGAIAALPGVPVAILFAVWIDRLPPPAWLFTLVATPVLAALTLAALRFAPMALARAPVEIAEKDGMS